MLYNNSQEKPAEKKVLDKKKHKSSTRKRSPKPKLEKVKPEDIDLLCKVIINFNKIAIDRVNCSKLEEANSIFTKLVKL